MTIDYYLFNDPINGISSIKDLGVVFKSNLSLQSHVDHISVKALNTLGFLIRNFKKISNEQYLKTL